mmetsp:Transcript_33665/g.40760  ORF Transcript_33665/g.40760 Transcript_33665/m.40760 type:complete len:100 (-) Transcript_33665:302-601(-)
MVTAPNTNRMCTELILDLRLVELLVLIGTSPAPKSLYGMYKNIVALFLPKNPNYPVEDPTARFPRMAQTKPRLPKIVKSPLDRFDNTNRSNTRRQANGK